MHLYGLLGHPLGHSFSASYFAEKFAKEGIEAEYRNFDFADVAEALEEILKDSRLRGFNVTIPHKRNVMPFLNELSDAAREIGAVNVVKVKRDCGGKIALKGFNSDYIGFRDSLRPLLKKTHKRALILGTGGASQAVVYALKKEGIETQRVSRTVGERKITYADLTSEVMEAFKIIVNCSPVGMFPKVDTCPDIPYEFLTKEHLLYDLVYNPTETLFMKRGKEKGAEVKNGLEMLHLQAQAAWNIWQGKEFR